MNVGKVSQQEPLRPLDRGVARRQAFLQFAREVFLEYGFEDASVNEIVRRAGGSLATLYGQFGSKEGLFLAVAEVQYERYARDIVPATVPDLPLEQGLQALGEQYLRATLSPDHLAFYRIVVGEGRKFPHLLQRYLADVQTIRAAAVDYLRTLTARENVVMEDLSAKAGYFWDIMRSGVHYPSLANPSFVLTEEQLVAHVAEGVKLFLNGAVKR
jgi:AcrR family transcriptional regulator